MPTSEVSVLMDILDVTATAPDRWEGRPDEFSMPRLFGGQVVSQSLVAAGRSVPDEFLPHSIHTHFLRSGRSDLPVSYHLERIHGGRQIQTRQVTAWQGDRLLSTSVVSCARDTEGLSHARSAPTTVGPEHSESLHEVSEPQGGLGAQWDRFTALEFRVEPVTDTAVSHAAAPPHLIWMRAARPLGDDPLVHRAAIAYASDILLMVSALSPHTAPGVFPTNLTRTWWGMSLDHAVWFHRNIRADEWMLFEHVTPTAGSSRVLIDGTVFDGEGVPGCRITQEAMMGRNESDG